MSEPHDYNKQAPIMLVRHRPTFLRYVVWDGKPFRDRWLMIAPVVGNAYGQPVSVPESQVGLVTDSHDLLQQITRGQVCLYDSSSRTVNIVDGTDKLLTQYEIITKVTP